MLHLVPSLQLSLTTTAFSVCARLCIVHIHKGSEFVVTEQVQILFFLFLAVRFSGAGGGGGDLPELFLHLFKACDDYNNLLELSEEKLV